MVAAPINTDIRFLIEIRRLNFKVALYVKKLIEVCNICYIV